MSVEGDASICDGLVHAVGWGLGVFYLDDGLIGLRDPEWLQGYINVRIGLMANVSKSKTMTFQLGVIRLGLLGEAVGWRSTGKGFT